MKNIEKCLFIICYFATIGNCLSQNSQESKVYFTNDYYGINGNSINVSNDSNILIVGERNGKGLFLSIDTSLNIQSAKEYNVKTSFQRIISNNDSAFYIVGSQMNDSTYNFDIILIKTDLFGSVLWSKRLELQGDLYFKGISLNKDNGIILLCHVNSKISPYSTYTLIIELNSSGQLLNSKKLSVSNKTLLTSGIILTSWNKYYVIGSVYSNSGTNNAFTSIIDTNLTILNTYVYNEISNLITLTEKDNRIVGIATNNNNEIGLFIQNSDCTLNWFNRYNCSNSFPAYIPTSENAFIKFHNNKIIFCTETINGALVISTDSLGNIIESRAFTFYPKSLNILHDKLLISGNGPFSWSVKGLSNSPQIGTILCNADSISTECSEDVLCDINDDSLTYTNLLISISNDGVDVTDINFQTNSSSILAENGCVSIVGVNPILNQSFISLFPNPANSKIKVKIEGVYSSNYNISFHDTHGKTLDKIVTENQETIIDISKYPQGVYFVRVIGNNFIKSEKVIILKND